MSWSYDTSLTTDKDQIRLLIGDTDSADPLLSDEEIAGLLALAGGVNAAAARAADTIAILFRREADELTDDLGQRIKYGDRAGVYSGIAARLRGSVAASAVSLTTYATNRGTW